MCSACDNEGRVQLICPVQEQILLCIKEDLELTGIQR